MAGPDTGVRRFESQRPGHAWSVWILLLSAGLTEQVWPLDSPGVLTYGNQGSVEGPRLFRSVSSRLKSIQDILHRTLA